MYLRTGTLFSVVIIFTLLLVIGYNKYNDLAVTIATDVRPELQQKLPPLRNTSPPVAATASEEDLGLDANRRQINQVVIEDRPQLAAQLRALVARSAAANDPDVIGLARALIDPVPKTAAIGIKRSREIFRTPQAAAVAKITNEKRGGFFIECGALDGERSSNTIWLEKKLGWTGLLIEMDPFFYTQLLGKNRRVFSVNACLSPTKEINMLPYRGSESGLGRLLTPGQQKVSDIHVPCFPLETLLLSINQTRIDYLSLDVEGLELAVLKTIPWDRIDINILSVEHVHAPEGKKTYKKFMETLGYRVHADIHFRDPGNTLYVDDFIFVKGKGNPTKDVNN